MSPRVRSIAVLLDDAGIHVQGGHYLGMFCQIPSNAGAHGIQSRAKENGGAVNGPCREHHVPGRKIAVQRPDPRGAVVFDQHPIDQHVATNLEVGSPTRRLQVRVVRGDTPAAAAGQPRGCNAEDAFGLGAVTAPVAAIHARGEQSSIEGRPLRFGTSLCGNAFGDALERGTDPVPAPTVAALGLPAIVIAGEPADRHLGVHRRAPSHAAPAQIRGGCLTVGAHGGERRPNPSRLAHGGEYALAADRVGRLRRSVVRTRLEEKNASIRIFSQSARERRAGGAGTNHNDVPWCHGGPYNNGPGDAGSDADVLAWRVLPNSRVSRSSLGMDARRR